VTYTPDRDEDLRKFAGSRRMSRANGPYFVDGNEDDLGQAMTSWRTLRIATGLHTVDEPDEVYDHNRPPEGQPGLWCQWVPTDDGTVIKWDQDEKFYSSAEWMTYLIAHFIGSNPIAKRLDSEGFAFLQGHVCNGEIYADGEDSDDNWRLRVVDNEVFTDAATLTYSQSTRITASRDGWRAIEALLPTGEVE
jgi:hypothetical protein